MTLQIASLLLPYGCNQSELRLWLVASRIHKGNVTNHRLITFGFVRRLCIRSKIHSPNAYLPLKVGSLSEVSLHHALSLRKRTLPWRSFQGEARTSLISPPFSPVIPLFGFDQSASQKVFFGKSELLSYSAGDAAPSTPAAP